MKPIPYKIAVFLLTCKEDQGKKSSGFQRFIIKWKRDCFISAVKLRWENIKTIQTLAGVTENGFSSTGFYVGFLLLIILVVGMYVAYTGLIKRETSKALHAVINFVVVFVLSASFIAYAPDYIKKINEFSSDISTASLDLGTKIMLPKPTTVWTLTL